LRAAHTKKIILQQVGYSRVAGHSVNRRCRYQVVRVLVMWARCVGDYDIVSSEVVGLSLGSGWF
jgi:hypothetical protein